MVEISVVLPCRNEKNTIRVCVSKIHKALKGMNYEIIVSDSSKDGSDLIALRSGAKVVKHNLKGYGNAYKQGLKKAKGKFIIIGDSDNTYDFLDIPRFLEVLKKYDFVIGSRLEGKIEKGAMKWLHRYIGNPILTLIFNFLFKTKLSDTHSGFRGFRREFLDNVKLESPGMEFALEMLIKARRFRIKEIPINYYKRKGYSKLNSFSDGIRHLKLMFKYRFG